MRIVTDDVGIMGTGTNMFRCALVHSSGVVYVGTYGPQPAIVWKFDPKVGRLVEIARPGEYQLDSMVEAPNGVVYIGTAYNAIVYRLDPKTDKVTSLGSPDVKSTPWIFTMTLTRSGEIYGAKGVGIFRLDWRRDRLESIGIVPGEHSTPGPNSSSPIIRELVEAPNGTIWGDTNRMLFRFDRKTGAIETLGDMVEREPACYGVLIAPGAPPTEDCWFSVASRFSGVAVKNPLYIYRAREKRLETLEIEGLKGGGLGSWWGEGKDARLVGSAEGDDGKPKIAFIDPVARKVVDRWEIPDGIPVPGLIKGSANEMWFMSGGRGWLLKGEPARKRLVVAAENPVPVECRSLAVSPTRVLGVDTYDCGYAFTRDIATGKIRDHGKVWADDHRSNHGPAAFAGADGRWLLANHSEAVQGLWVTDTKTDKHWRIGEPAVQLVAASDGAVWGTTGSNPPAYKWDPGKCWVAGWAARPGTLFRYEPGAEKVALFAGLGAVGPVAEAPGRAGRMLVAMGRRLAAVTPEGKLAGEAVEMPAEVIGAAHDAGRTVVYVVLKDGSLHEVRAGLVSKHVAEEFGPIERGLFVLPKTGRVVGVADDGTVTVCDPEKGKVARAKGPTPQPAGPAVDPAEDAWYYADRQVVRYRIEE